MSNLVLGYKDYLLASGSYVPTFPSFGTWSESYPLTNLQNRLLSKRARSVGITADATKFRVDLGVARAIKIVSFLRHNAATGATVRIRGTSDATYTTFYADSTAVSMYPEGFPSVESKLRYQEDFHYVFSSDQTYRYWQIEIVDTNNTSGYFELGRCVFAPSFSPAINASFGASIKLETETARTRALFGVDTYDRKEPRRIFQFGLSDMALAEFQTVFDMQWDRGIDKEILFCLDPAETGKHLKRITFLSTIRELSPIEFPYHNAYSTAFELMEVL